MGVPSFFRWISEKYPKIMVQLKEDFGSEIQGVVIPPDTTKPNPNGFEIDNLYLDFNGYMTWKFVVFICLICLSCVLLCLADCR